MLLTGRLALGLTVNFYSKMIYVSNYTYNPVVSGGGWRVGRWPVRPYSMLREGLA
jgi:hypothetical protein